MNWQQSAACKTLDVPFFFAPEGERYAERLIRETNARALCASCPVRVQCLDYALGNTIRHGIWGGLNAEERERERRRRKGRPATGRHPQHDQPRRTS